MLKAGNFVDAASKYTEGIEHVDAEDDEAAKNILKTLRMNFSQACIKVKKYSDAIEACTKVLKEDEKNLKTFYRRAVAYLGNQEFEKAKVCYFLYSGRCK